MDYNYHTHTKRCHHAEGEAEDYIKKAIDGGIKYMGFSDHAPFVFPDGFESRHRVPVSEVEGYFSEIGGLREKYKDKIDIKNGFELEYYPKYFDEMVKNAVAFGAEYLILGHHFLGNERPDGFMVTLKTDSLTLLEEYTNSVLSGMQSGIFTYVAHPDMFNFVGDSAAYDENMRKICIAARKENLPLEINFLGIRAGRNYPNEAFWKIAGEEKPPVTFGFDAHDPNAACDRKSLSRAEEIVKKYNLNYIGRPIIKLLQK